MRVALLLALSQRVIADDNGPATPNTTSLHDVDRARCPVLWAYDALARRDSSALVCLLGVAAILLVAVFREVRAGRQAAANARAVLPELCAALRRAEAAERAAAAAAAGGIPRPSKSASAGSAEGGNKGGDIERKGTGGPRSPTSVLQAEIATLAAAAGVSSAELDAFNAAAPPAPVPYPPPRRYTASPSNLGVNPFAEPVTSPRVRRPRRYVRRRPRLPPPTEPVAESAPGRRTCAGLGLDPPPTGGMM